MKILQLGSAHSCRINRIVAACGCPVDPQALNLNLPWHIAKERSGSRSFSNYGPCKCGRYMCRTRFLVAPKPLTVSSETCVATDINYMSVGPTKVVVLSVRLWQRCSLQHGQPNLEDISFIEKPKTGASARVKPVRELNLSGQMV